MKELESNSEEELGESLSKKEKHPLVKAVPSKKDEKKKKKAVDPCTDKEHPAACRHKAELCFDKTHGKKVQEQCSRTCGICVVGELHSETANSCTNCIHQPHVQTHMQTC